MKPGKSVQAAVITILILALLLPACAPRQTQIFTVGIISPNVSLEPIIQGFKDGLEKYGYIEGQNITYLYYGPVGEVGIEQEIKKMLLLEVDVILALGPSTAAEAKNLTEDNGTPVVFTPVIDPVAAGLVASIKQPGGNMTGVMIRGYISKELEWLVKELPSTRKVFVAYDPNQNGDVLDVQELENTAKVFGITIVAQPVQSTPEIPSILENMPADIDAIFMLNNVSILSSFSRFARIASQRQIPISTSNQEFLESGALLAYGPRFYELGRQTARLTEQIFKGIAPGTLPIEQADFYLAINKKTAANLNIQFSDTILKAADVIIK